MSLVLRPMLAMQTQQQKTMASSSTSRWNVKSSLKKKFNPRQHCRKEKVPHEETSQVVCQEEVSKKNVKTLKKHGFGWNLQKIHLLLHLLKTHAQPGFTAQNFITSFGEANHKVFAKSHPASHKRDTLHAPFNAVQWLCMANKLETPPVLHFNWTKKKKLPPSQQVWQ